MSSAPVIDLPALTPTSRTAAGLPLSNIEPHEESAAIELVHSEFEKLCGKRPPKPTGWYVLTKTFIRPEEYKTITREDGTKHTLFIPDMARNEDEYQSVAALVLDMGPDAYQDRQKFPNGAWCKVGDWVVIPRYEGFKFKFKGVPLQQLPDDHIMGVIQDPMDVVPTHLADKV